MTQISKKDIDREKSRAHTKMKEYNIVGPWIFL
jgi:hypothetical protein